ncbi:MAG: hypothetical protein JWP95_653 [Actinotalea sp.]|nr:hypothetical protein [Actinotalea sp.]
MSAEPPGPGTSTPGSAVPASVRAQILATEHWSLLATRSTTWSEVMSRISIHLTVTSAALVVLALVAQASGFGTPFWVLAIGLASAALVLGTLTGTRVMNASVDDAALLLGMNRLRAAYLEIDPSLAPYLVTSPHDDMAGLMTTYTMGRRRSTFSHVAASTSMFMHVVNGIVAGTLGALVAHSLGLGPGAVAAVGAGVGLVYLAALLEYGRRAFSGPPVAFRFPTP